LATTKYEGRRQIKSFYILDYPLEFIIKSGDLEIIFFEIWENLG
jgi:hypothetical protein